MPLYKSYKQAYYPDTVVPVVYIESYKDPIFKKHIARYKFDIDFSKDWYTARSYIQHILSDICTDIQQKHRADLSCVLFTSPPSTMYERKEKVLDTTRDLFNDIVPWKKMFTIHKSYVRHHKAQHIGADRKKRILQKQKYKLYFLAKIYIWFLLVMRKKYIVHIYVIDDIATTGGTLKECSDLLSTYLQKWQKKKPELLYSVQVFSIGH